MPILFLQDHSHPLPIGVCYAGSSRGSDVGDGHSLSSRGIAGAVGVVRATFFINVGVVGVGGFLAAMVFEDIVGTASERGLFKDLGVIEALVGVLRKSVRQSTEEAGELGIRSERSCIMSFLSSCRNQFRKDSSITASLCWFMLEFFSKMDFICCRSATNSW
mmetsp:Transcript_14849/g.30786  ORF Transcript_14849/g.30786 Transcript_14849/m.30786 type:complete len:162 (+) Transcript_14849:120-605(+)